MTARKMGPSDVMKMLLDGLHEMESSGYEVAQSAQSIGEPLPWFGPEGETPVLEWHDDGRLMMFQLPDGSRVQVKASRVRAPKPKHAPA